MTVSVKAESCWKCGAEIREGSVFCYGCGADLTTSEETPAANTTRLDDKPVVKNDIESLKQSLIDKDEAEVGVDDTINAMDPELHLTEEPPPISIPIPSKDSRPELKTAASIKKRSKNIYKSEVKYVWEEPQGFSLRFLISSMFFVILTLVLVYLAILFH